VKSYHWIHLGQTSQKTATTLTSRSQKSDMKITATTNIREIPGKVYAPFLSALSQIARSMAALMAREIRVLRDHAQLKEMPDYLLRDIGLSRADIIGANALRRRDAIHQTNPGDSR